MRIFVIGLPGVGKTTFAQKLAEHLSINFFDLDALVVSRTRMAVTEYFSRYGEEAFRKIESEELNNLLKEDTPFVLATGGGTPCHTNNMQIMLTHGVCVLLKHDLAVVAQQILKNGDDRPMFLGMRRDQIEKKLSELWDERKVYYEQTHIITGVEAVEKPQLLTKRLELFTKKGNSLIDIIEID